MCNYSPDIEEAFVQHHILSSAPAVNTSGKALASGREHSWVSREMGELNQLMNEAISNNVIKEIKLRAVLVFYGCCNNYHKLDLRFKTTRVCYLTVLEVGSPIWASLGQIQGMFRAVFLLEHFRRIHFLTCPELWGDLHPLVHGSLLHPQNHQWTISQSSHPDTDSASSVL